MQRYPELKPYPTEKKITVLPEDTPDGAYWSDGANFQRPGLFQVIVVGRMCFTPEEYRQELEKVVRRPVDHESQAFMDFAEDLAKLDGYDEFEIKRRKLIAMERGFVSLMFKARAYV